jgi:hypothetical protein
MNANPRQWNQASADLRQLARDEWGDVDPRLAAVPAALQVTRSEQSAAIVPCAFCCEPLMPNEKYCSRCLHQVAVSSIEAHDAPVPVSSPAARKAPVTVSSTEVHDAPAAPPASARAPSGAGAMYALESSVRCPQCENDIRTLKVLRVLRTQVSFTSTLPRKGYVIVCPECDHLLSAELSGLI